MVGSGRSPTSIFHGPWKIAAFTLFSFCGLFLPRNTLFHRAVMLHVQHSSIMPAKAERHVHCKIRACSKLPFRVTDTMTARPCVNTGRHVFMTPIIDAPSHQV